MLVPIAKLLMTKEKFFYEKFQKNIEGDYKFLNSVIGTSFSLQDVQNMFIEIY